MKPLNILISNDDGVFAEGIRALARSAHKKGHNVMVVCPDQDLNGRILNLREILL